MNFNTSDLRCRAEYTGIVCLIVGVIVGLLGIVGLSMAWEFGLAGLFFGTAATGAGMATLSAATGAPRPTV